jgi:hypothetical protein
VFQLYICVSSVLLDRFYVFLFLHVCRAASVEHILGQFGVHFEQVWDQFETRVGPIWSGFGPVLDECQASFGLTVPHYRRVLGSSWAARADTGGQRGCLFKSCLAAHVGAALTRQLSLPPLLLTGGTTAVVFFGVDTN